MERLSPVAGVVLVALVGLVTATVPLEVGEGMYSGGQYQFEFKDRQGNPVNGVEMRIRFSNGAGMDEKVAHVSHITGRVPAHVRFIRKLLKKAFKGGRERKTTTGKSLSSRRLSQEQRQACRERLDRVRPKFPTPGRKTGS